MKKLLLCAMLLAGSAAMKAANVEMLIGGTAAGSAYTVNLTEANWADDGWGTRTFDLEITPNVKDNSTVNITLSAEAVSIETFDYEGDSTKPGFTLCTANFPAGNNCYMLPLKNLALTLNNANKSYIHCTYTCPSDVAMPAIKCVYRISWIGGDSGELLLTLDSKGSSAVESIESADAPKVYYNLQGQEVANPSSGLYIVRQGDKTYKQVIR